MAANSGGVPSLKKSKTRFWSSVIGFGGPSSSSSLSSLESLVRISYICKSSFSRAIPFFLFSTYFFHLVQNRCLPHCRLRNRILLCCQCILLPLQTPIRSTQMLHEPWHLKQVMIANLSIRQTQKVKPSQVKLGYRLLTLFLWSGFFGRGNLRLGSLNFSTNLGYRLLGQPVWSFQCVL